MADAENTNVEATAPEGASEVKKVPSTQTDAEKRLAEVQAELAKNEELLKKVRKFEKENKERAEAALREQGKYKELFEAAEERAKAFETKYRTKVVDDVLTKALTDAKAKSVSTVMKLIDRSKIEITEADEVDAKSVEKLIAEIQKSDPILFGEVETKPTPQVPQVKKAGEGEAVGGFEKELSNAKSQKDIIAVMKKYGKM